MSNKPFPHSASFRRFLLDDGPTIISSRMCNNTRIDPYELELELSYVYRIDFVEGTTLNLTIVENALNQAIVGKLAKCDAQGQPMYALDLSSSHINLQNGNCTSTIQHCVCQLVEASTYILFDNSTLQAQELVYDAIQASLINQYYLHTLDPNIRDYHFVSALPARLVLPPVVGQGRPSQKLLNATVATVAASVSFLLIAIFVFGIFRRVTRNRRQSEPTQQPKRPQHQQRGTTEAVRVGIKSRTEYFEQLTDDDEDDDDERSLSSSLPRSACFPLSPSEMSDITFDDSVSILSSISRTTSKLQRIEEEDGDGPYDEEQAYTSGESVPSDVAAAPFMQFISAHRRSENGCRQEMGDYGPKRVGVALEITENDKHSDLIGCQYVNDECIQDGQTLHEVAPMEDWDTSDDSIIPFEPFFRLDFLETAIRRQTMTPSLPRIQNVLAESENFTNVIVDAQDGESSLLEKQDNGEKARAS